MKFAGILLVGWLILSGAPATASAANGCATTPARLAQVPKLELPPDAKLTAKEIAFDIDVGSDGRARGLQLDRSSGDGAVDLLVRQTLETASYDPPQTGCVTYSGALRIAFSLPTDAAAPSTSTPVPTPTPVARLNGNCTPYVHAFLTPVARDRKRTGSATLEVALDAAGTQSAPPVLRKSTGSPVLDQEAIRIARTGQYGFLLGSSCEPQAFTYLLELTFQ